MHDTVISPDAPLSDTLMDVGVPSAQSSVDGLGNSLGYGAAPYPGDTVVAAPGLVASVACSSAQRCDGLPAYPLIAASSYPATPDAKVDGGAFDLRAHSTQNASSGEASAGGSAQSSSVGRLHALTNTTSDPATDGVVASATSSADVINVAGVLRVGSVLATAKAELTADGKVKKQSSLSVSGASVGGVTVEITPSGIDVAGQKHTLPSVSPAASALKSAGITVRLIEPSETATGVTSGALVITQEQKINGKPSTHTYTFGAARADVVAVKAPPTTGSFGGTTPPVASVPNTGGTTAISGTPATAGSTTPGTPSRTTPAPVVQPNTQAIRGLAAFARMWTAQLYLILVVAGLVMIGAARLTTTLAVRRTWTS
jgi:hypothetical protein